MKRHRPYDVKQTNKQLASRPPTRGQAPYLVTIVHGGDDLPEEVPGLPLAEAPPLADVIVQLPFARVLHDDHNLIFVLKHCRGGNSNTQTPCLSDELTEGHRECARRRRRCPRASGVNERTATGQDTSRAIRCCEELARFSGQVNNVGITTAPGRTFAVWRECASLF